VRERQTPRLTAGAAETSELFREARPIIILLNPAIGTDRWSSGAAVDQRRYTRNYGESRIPSLAATPPVRLRCSTGVLRAVDEGANFPFL
jgi:hypothetical protein